MRKHLSIFLAVLLITTLALNPKISGASAVDKNNHSSYYMPSLVIEDTIIPEVNAGSKISVEFDLKNNGYTATDIIVTPAFGNDSPFTLNNLTNAIPVGSISKGSKKTVKFEVDVSPTAKPGSYPIPLDINYIFTSYAEDPAQKIKDSISPTIYVKVSNKSVQPKLIITKTVTEPTIITPGQESKLSVLFENKGTVEAQDISVKLSGLNNNGGFYVSTGSDSQYIKKVNGGSVSYVNFNVTAANNIKKGAHELKVTFSYGGIEESQSIFLDVGGASDQSSNLVMEKIVSPSGTISSNQDFTIKFDLRNNGGIDAKNILVKADSGDSSIVPKTTNIKRINSIGPNSSESLEFVFSPTTEAISKNYPISITVEYEDDLNLDGEKRPVLNQYVGAYIDGGGDPSKGKPKLIIDKYVFEPQLVKAGENFEMKLSFYNTNSSKTVKNIKIFLTAEAGGTNPDSPSAGGSVFTPVDSSNTFYIDSIPPKGRVEKAITMFTVPDALAKTH
ncbi:MAG: hypothetical protein WCZ27_04705, partial [Tissierellaceae bacterium]